MSRFAISIIALLALTAAAGLAEAKDSTWLLCKGTGSHGTGDTKETTSIVTSLLEHRSVDSSSRDLYVTFMYGDNVIRGAVLGTSGSDAAVKGSKLELTSDATPKKSTPVFTGTVELAKSWKTFTMTGTIDFSFGGDSSAARVPFSAKLSCESLKN